MAKLKLHNPTKRPDITQGFGEANTAPSMLPAYQKMGLKGHNGWDMRAVDGTPVYAAHDGRVVYAGYDGSNGLLVVIRTTEKFDYGSGQEYFKTLYGHLKKDSLIVTGGQTVIAGQKIAEADNTGFSTGSHLHFGLKPIQQGEDEWTWFNIDGAGYNGAIDPTPYMVPFQIDLVIGNTHEDIVRLQAELVKLGFFPKEQIYAKYGALTANAVLAFQRAYVKLSWYEEYVLKGTKFGPKTRQALNTVLGF